MLIDYDRRGLIVRRSKPTEINGDWQPTGPDAGDWRYTAQAYDWQGRPTETTRLDGYTSSLAYGGCGCAGGETVTARDEAGRRRKLYKDTLGRLVKVEELDWEQVVAEVNATGAWQRGHVYLGGQLLAVQASGAAHWQHEDPVTKAKALTDSAGAVTSFTLVDPWGGEAASGRQQNSSQQRRKYTSYERDVHNRDEAMQRQYSEWYARFPQADPSEGSYDLTDRRVGGF